MYLNDEACMSSEAKELLYPERLRGTQIRLLRILPTTVCKTCGYLHGVNDKCTTAYQDDSSVGGSSSDTASCNSQRDFHDECRGHGCIHCDRICCELVTLSLDGIADQYESLSYVWGDSVLKQTITVNGTSIPVTRNLEAALRRVRNTEHTDLLWVDAVCINQMDTSEKNVQVTRMKDIYSNSGAVLVWLGDATIDLDNDSTSVQQAVHAMDLLESIYLTALSNDLASDPDPLRMVLRGNVAFQDPRSVGLPAVHDEVWTDLKYFLRRPWFSRVWIIQEVATAKEACILVGKSAKMEWTHISTAAMWLMHHDYMDNIIGILNCFHIVYISNCRTIPSAALLQRLSPSEDFQSTLPHDQIFARLGMTKEGSNLEAYPRLRVDYGRDWRDVYRDVVRHCIETPGSFSRSTTLHVLNLVRHLRDDDGKFAWAKDQCSWIPAWNEDIQGSPIGWRIYGWNLKTTNDTEAAMVESADPRILSLKGILVDKIAITYPHMVQVFEDDRSFSPNVFQAVAKLWFIFSCDKKATHFPPYKHMADLFAQVLCAGGVEKLKGVEASVGMYFAMYWEAGLSDAKLSSFVKKERIRGPKKKDVRVWNDLSTVSEADRANIKTKMTNEFRVSISLDRVLYVTRNGMRGLGPTITLPGDNVCVMYGGTTPYVVREVDKDVLDLEEEANQDTEGSCHQNDAAAQPSGLKAFMQRLSCSGKGRVNESRTSNEGVRVVQPVSTSQEERLYRFVGEGYVEGLMNGEALHLKDRGKLK
jgi:hypothetical protein